jgi:hypothetical protein
MVRQVSFFYGVVFVFTLISFSSCEKQPAVETEIATLGQRTIPANARIIQGIDIERYATSVHALWEFQLDWQWAEYVDWLKTSLDSRYTMVGNDNHQARFRRPLPGDTYNLEVQTLSRSSLHVRAKFCALPN